MKAIVALLLLCLLQVNLAQEQQEVEAEGGEGGDLQPAGVAGLLGREYREVRRRKRNSKKGGDKKTGRGQEKSKNVEKTEGGKKATEKQKKGKGGRGTKVTKKQKNNRKGKGRNIATKKPNKVKGGGRDKAQEKQKNIGIGKGRKKTTKNKGRNGTSHGHPGRLEGSVAPPGSDLTLSVGPMETRDMETLLGRRQTRGTCCLWANFYCKRPCAGKPCTANCRVKCFPFGWISCHPVPCQLANPHFCIGSSATTTTVTTSTSTTTTTTTTTTTKTTTTTTTTTSTTTTSTTSTTTSSTTTTAVTRCDTGWTEVGSKCYKVSAGPANFLTALTDCIALGGGLASLESQQEQDAVFSLTGSTGAYLGLTDFLDEGTFSWVDGATVSFTAWRNNQPNNGGSNQHCVWIRPDGEWDDITCKRENAFVCQKKI